MTFAARFIAALIAAALIAFACTTAERPSPSPSGTSATVWLCRPGLADDPCTASLATTVIHADGSSMVRTDVPDPNAPIDCFYVYPTVSRQKTMNADLTIDPEERAVAVAQASRFSQVCRVWAPMYRQRTLASLARGLNTEPAAEVIAYESVRSAWRDYMDHFNNGRPVVYIGHSQGAVKLAGLLRREIDPSDALRARLVSAILLGANVAVAAGKDSGGTFENIPMCRAATQTGCVIAYSSFSHTPPPDSVFGRPGIGITLRSGSRQALQIACTDPSSLSGGNAPLDAYFGGSRSLVRVSTPWVEYPDLYTASCESATGATWLQVNDVGQPGDARPRVREANGPTWGWHGDDVNLALGDLVRDVGQQARSYLDTHH